MTTAEAGAGGGGAAITIEPRQRTRVRYLLGLLALNAAAFTLLVSVTSTIDFAYRSPSLHVAVETAAALISLLAAQLVYGRFRRSLDRRDLLLTAALGLFAGSNLLFAAIPAIAAVERGAFETWASAVAGMLAAVLFAIAAFTAPRPVLRPGARVRQVAVVCALTLLAIAGASGAARNWLPIAIDPELSPESLTRPRVVGPPALLAIQLAGMCAFAVAVVGFARRAERTLEPLMLWFAAGATLAAFARLNYFLFPSRFSDYFYTGDVLRLGFFVALLIGGMREIRLAQRELERAAVVNERRRLARDLHDGIAQDLAFIVQQASQLDRRNGHGAIAAGIATAARRALDESRGVIAALVRPTDEPLSAALGRVAEETAARWGARVDISCVDEIELPTPTRETLLRIVGEAVTNAARHGQARRIELELAERPKLQLRIADDGVGFDPRVERRSGQHGLTTMRERAAGIGAELQIDSSPGAGTEVVVILP